MRKCRCCHQFKPFDCFKPRKGAIWAPWDEPKLTSICDDCRPTYYHRWRIKQAYGIDYDALLAKQNGRCASCSALPDTRRLHVDHDHITGKVRGLLCHGCNIAIGMLKEDANRAQALADYLRKK